ncbi:hypothetical protein [Actinacidiphila bryophytorum]|uniref:hypothetical protein n=1 Tax=Actinacidiphila bryophytorum TaxID=1436133 RepID=UPI002176D1E5|nr:hypothetical protein [Actinacidiphila bryophytorum]UWE12583.1 hypothetical protein NYE86_30455 [Actinacidiphila bryophytorum]
MGTGAGDRTGGGVGGTASAACSLTSCWTASGIQPGSAGSSVASAGPPSLLTVIRCSRSATVGRRSGSLARQAATIPRRSRGSASRSGCS